MCAVVDGHCHLKKVSSERIHTIAHLRMPVRSAVENVRNRFTMLSHTIPACFCLPCEGEEDCTWLDQIVHVCCVLATLALLDIPEDTMESFPHPIM